MEELGLIFEFSVLVYSHCGIRGLRGHEFEEWVNANSLHKLAVSLKCLNFLILSLLDGPED